MPLTSAPNEVRIRATGEVVTEQAFRSMHPRTSFPRVLTTEIFHDFGADPVLEAPAPTVAQYQSAVRNGVAQDAQGNWVQAWTVRAWTQAEIDTKKKDDKAAKWEAIKAHRDRLSDTGGYLVEGKWFHSDGKSKTQQLSLYIMGANVPAVQWKTMDGTFVTMTQALAAAIFQAAAAQDQALFAKAEEHRAAMEASADPASYDFSAGWPATFPG